MDRKITLTQKQKETLGFIDEYVKKQGESPTISEIAIGLSLKSLRSVTQRLDLLERKGFIKRGKFKHRGISVLDPMGSHYVPFGMEKIGVIASAGCDAMQIYAQQQYDEFLMVDKRFLDPRKDIVAIKAIGNSMVDFGIRNGDYVLVEVTGDIQSGDRIVAIVDGMAVIKKFKKIPGAIILEPESKKGGYSPIVLKEGFGKIFGKVERVIPMTQQNNDIEYVYDSENEGKGRDSSKNHYHA